MANLKLQNFHTIFKGVLPVLQKNINMQCGSHLEGFCDFQEDTSLHLLHLQRNSIKSKTSEKSGQIRKWTWRTACVKKINKKERVYNLFNTSDHHTLGSVMVSDQATVITRTEISVWMSG